MKSRTDFNDGIDAESHPSRPRTKETKKADSPSWSTMALSPVDGDGAKVQTKLNIGQAHDPLEKEADDVAGRVMRMPSSESDGTGVHGNAGATRVQRMCADCEDEVQRKPVNQDESEELQLKSTTSEGGGSPISDSTNNEIQSLQGGGEPLSNTSRSFFEPRFGRNFSGVRVHRNEKASDVAQSVNARAFTLRQDIVFGAGEYSPETQSGKNLLAHELVHVGQQTGDKTTSINSSRLALHHSSPQIARQPSSLKDEAKTFTDLNGLWMHEMLQKFSTKSKEDIAFLISNVNKYAKVIHEQRMLAALLAVRDKGKKSREKFESDNEVLLAAVNPDQVSLILDYVQMVKKHATQINVYFYKVVREEPGFDDEYYPRGHLNFYKKGKLAYSTTVSGGGHEGGLTDTVKGAKIHRKENGNHKSSNGGVAMPWPIYFKGTQAIHQGSLGHASLSCVHVPDIKLMEKMHGDAKISHTVVNIYYKQNVLDTLCPLRTAHEGKVKFPCPKPKP